MWQIWKYQDCTGIVQHGRMDGFTDYGGTDVTYRFHRLGADGLPIMHDNGGRTIDLVNGPALKAANRVGAVQVGQPYRGE